MEKAKRNFVMIIVLSAIMLMLWFVPIIFCLIIKDYHSIALLYFAVCALSIGYGYILNEYLIRKEN